MDTKDTSHDTSLPPELLPPERIAKILGVSRSKAYKMVSDDRTWGEPVDIAEKGAKKKMPRVPLDVFLEWYKAKRARAEVMAQVAQDNSDQLSDQLSLFSGAA